MCRSQAACAAHAAATIRLRMHELHQAEFQSLKLHKPAAGKNAAMLTLHSGMQSPPVMLHAACRLIQAGASSSLLMDGSHVIS